MFLFGDIIINHWASNDNPHRVGIVVSYNTKTIRCTNGRGEFWELVNDSKSSEKYEKVGYLSLAEYNIRCMIEADGVERKTKP